MLIIPLQVDILEDKKAYGTFPLSVVLLNCVCRGSQFSEEKNVLSRTICLLCSFGMNFGLKLFTFQFSEGLNVESSVVQYFTCACAALV